MANINHYLTVAEKRKRRVRSKLHGTAARPRLSVNKSNKFVYIQAINDDTGVTIASADDVKIRKAIKKGSELTKTETAVKATEELLITLKKAKVKAIVFDRGQYKYHGRVKAVATVLRDGGIEV
jgi:large subunit ribosomal protein L18